MTSIPADERCTLQAIVEDDLRRADILSASVCVNEDGSIEVEELTLRIYGGREVAISPEMRGRWPVITLEVNTGSGWREMSIAEDYGEELVEMTAEPWHAGDDIDRPEDRI